VFQQKSLTTGWVVCHLQFQAGAVRLQGDGRKRYLGQVWDGVAQVVAHRVDNNLLLLNSETAINHKLCFQMQAVAHPAHPHAVVFRN
jgi:hypothetical protein